MLNSLVNPGHLFYTQKNDEIIFTEKFEKALRRVFRIFDKERKGFVTKSEFNKIHENIFEVKLESDHFTAIKECIKIINSISHTGGNKNIFSNEDEITSDGFINLNKLAVQVGESQTCWSTLRKFGYDDNLELDNWYFINKKYVKYDNSQFVIELSDYAKNILNGLFLQFKNEKSKNDNPYITEKEWHEIFYTLIDNYNSDFAFDKIFRTYKNNNEKQIYLDDWVLIWTSYTRINPEEAFKTFLYLGFDLEFDQFIKKTTKKEVNLFRELDQKTIHVCFISQSQEGINIFFKYFYEFYSLSDSYNKTKEILLKSNGHSIIVSNYLINEIEASITNFNSNLLSFRKYDLLIFAEDFINSKVFNYVSYKMPFMVLISNSNEKFYEERVSLITDEKLNQKAIVDKILSFVKEPINYLRVSERTEVVRIRRNNNIIFSLKFFMLGLAGIAVYYLGRKKFLK
jgi:Ras family protein T1